MPEVTLTEIKQLAEQQGRAWETYKQENDAALSGLKKSDGEHLQKLGRIDAELEEIGKAMEKVATAEALAKLTEKQASLETALKRLPMAAGGDGDAPADVDFGFGIAADGKESPQLILAKHAFRVHKESLRRAGKLEAGIDLTKDFDRERCEAYIKSEFPAYIRLPESKFKARFDEKALIVGSDPDGGYSVTPAMSDRMIVKQFETSPMMSIAAVETIGTNMLQIPRDEGEFAFGWGSEVSTRSETNTSQVGLTQIPVFEWYAMPKASQQMLEDSAWNVEAWITNKVGAVTGRGFETTFFTGATPDRPRGILTYDNGTTNGTIEQVVSGLATSFGADWFFNIEEKLKEYYRRNARWLVNRSTRSAIRRLKDGIGRYLWNEDLRTGQPATLLGYPVTGAEDMPAVGAGALPVAFGDFREGYTIVRRLGMTMLRDPYTAKPHVLFYFRGRLGGAVVNFESFKLGKIAAS